MACCPSSCSSAPTTSTSRDVIGQAKGILMHRAHLTGLQAFTMLTRASMDTNMKLVDVARWLVSDDEDGLRKP